MDTSFKTQPIVTEAERICSRRRRLISRRSCRPAGFSYCRRDGARTEHPLLSGSHTLLVHDPFPDNAPDLTWGRPFIGVGAGWTWTKMSGNRDNSFLYTIDTGVEFQVTKALSITPVVSFTDTTSFHTDNKWAYGVKANYWINSQWGLTTGVMRNNTVNTTYSVGTTLRF